MINLLPPYEKQELKLAGIQIKISIIFAYFLFCLALLILIFSFLDYYIILQTVEFDNAVITRTRELESYKFQDFKEATTQVNQKLARIQLFQQDEILISSFFEDIVSLAEHGIFFSGVGFTKDSRLIQKKELEKPVKEIYARVNLAGTATTREVLYFFNKTLLQQEHFQDVYFSPDSWTESPDAAFSVSFKIVY